MKKHNHDYKTVHGSALVYALIMVSIVAVLFTGVIQFITSHVRDGLNAESKEQSLHIAEAGVYFYRWYLAHQVEGLTAQQIFNFWQNGTPYGVGSPYEEDYESIGRYSISVTPPVDYSTVVSAEVTGWTYSDPDIKRTIRVRFRRPSWSEFSVLANANIRFGDGTDVFGPIHSNGGVRFDGVAHNVVSSSQESYVDPDTGLTKPGVWTNWAGEYNSNMGSNVFLAGKDFPVPLQDFNGIAADFALMKDAALGGNGYFFDSDGQGRHIILHADGTADISRVDSYDSSSYSIISESNTTSYELPEWGVIYVQDNAWVEGVIDGKKLTIVAADSSAGQTPNIFIGNDITYTNYDGNDILGIAAEGDISTMRDSEDNLRIDAALLAQTGRVGRKYYGSYCILWKKGICKQEKWDTKDTITVYGAMATNKRYGFAYTDGSGYVHRNLLYDNNLLYEAPPYFPTGNAYAIDLWEEL